MLQHSHCFVLLLAVQPVLQHLASFLKGKAGELFKGALKMQNFATSGGGNSEVMTKRPAAVENRVLGPGCKRAKGMQKEDTGQNKGRVKKQV